MNRYIVDISMGGCEVIDFIPLVEALYFDGAFNKGRSKIYKLR